MKRILVTGALGQVGSELVVTLRQRYGVDNVVASDLRMPFEHACAEGFFLRVDCTDCTVVKQAVEKYQIDTIFHLAALLSAVAEAKPHAAWDVNMGGLYNVLEVARENRCAVFFPSSIGAFGPTTPMHDTPQDTLQRPTTMYGVTKVAGELLCDYYHKRFGVDTRGVRFPGIISTATKPGGGTTDYAVEMFYAAIRDKRYTSYLKRGTYLDMMYMPDAIKAAIQLMEADPRRFAHRNSFNVTAMSFEPEMLAAEIRRHIPDFVLDYQIDPMLQAIADSWPNKLDDTCARQEWGWKPDYGLASMAEDMFKVLGERYRLGKL
jgi:nucleoside-diphosphate-sugar epimerase